MDDDQAARALGLSRRSLQRALQVEGTTFSETRQRVRVSTADLLMRNDGLSLTDIAFCTGFSDQAHFARTFRRHSDVPPSILRGILARSAVAKRS